MLRRLLRHPSAWFAAAVLLAVLVIGVAGPALAPYDPLVGSGQILAGSSTAHPFGTDYLGRDVLSRLLAGAPTSILGAVEVAGIALVVGAVPGLLSVHLGRVFEWVTLRFVDTLIALPFLVFAVTMTALLGNGLTQAMISVGILLSPLFYRVTRAASLAVSGSQYVEAATLAGASPAWVLRKHVLPKIVAPLGIAVANAIGTGLVIVASLTFLGIGVQPPAPTWGGILSSDLGYLDYQPWAPVFPIAFIVLTVLALNLLADLLRDAQAGAGVSAARRRRMLRDARRRAAVRRTAARQAEAGRASSPIATEGTGA